MWLSKNTTPQNDGMAQKLNRQKKLSNFQVQKLEQSRNKKEERNYKFKESQIRNYMPQNNTKGENTKNQKKTSKSKPNIITTHCGHYFEAEELYQMIKSRMRQQKYEIRCPKVIREGIVCNQVWDCKHIAGLKILSQKELGYLESQLSVNWISAFSKTCPKCKQTLSKIDFDSNRVQCPSCRYSNFCYLCLNPWTDRMPLEILLVDWDTLRQTSKRVQIKSKFCGNQQCYDLNYAIKDSPRINLNLFDRNNDDIRCVQVPQFRPCPGCEVRMQFKNQGKYVMCKCCKKCFCWICLSESKHGYLPCGKLDVFCGKIDQGPKSNKK